MIDFCGTKIEVFHDSNGPDGKMCFRMFEDGQFKKWDKITTRHPNVMKHVLMGKKGLGLWLKEWSMGISEGSFSRKEILQEFEDRKIFIPECFLKDFDNMILKETNKRL
jgi:hypothetical protein